MNATFDRDHAHQFLTNMYSGLPGYMWVGMFVPKRRGEFFATTPEGIDAAVTYAAKLDHLWSPSGIYFRCTTVDRPLDNGQRGGADDTCNVPFLWDDLDFGTAGHKDANLPPTGEEAAPLITEAGLPEPGVVIHSGGGYYHLWKTAGWFTPDEVATMSVRIQAWIEHASEQHGWSYGTGVSDLARVLRLPGSVNRKVPDNPRACRVIGGTGHITGWSCLPKDMPEVPPKPGKPAASIPAPRTTPFAGSGTGQRGVFDALAETASWADILEPAGWEYVRTDSAGELWMRPGGSDSEYSARAFEHNLVCHSESAGLPAGKGQRLTKGRVWAWLHHGGDLSAAAIALIRGDHELPDAVRTAIEDVSRLTVLKLTSARQTPDLPNGSATDMELESWLASFVAEHRPDRLARHIAWAIADAPRKLPRHAERMVVESITGSYPAEAVVLALAAACQHHGVTDPEAPRELLGGALGAALSALEGVA